MYKFLKRKKIDYNLQTRVYKYLEHLCLKEDYDSREKEGQILLKLSQSLRKDVLVQANARVLAGCSTLLENFSEDTLEELSEQARSINVAPDEPVFAVNNFKNEKLVSYYICIKYIHY
jgi:hypothetical protein